MQHKRCAAITAQLHRTATMFTGLLLRKGRVFSGHRTKGPTASGIARMEEIYRLTDQVWSPRKYVTWPATRVQ